MIFQKLEKIENVRKISRVRIKSVLTRSQKKRRKTPLAASPPATSVPPRPAARVASRRRAPVSSRCRTAAGCARHLANWANFQNIFANFWRARSRLYRNQILQENMRWKALAEIYTMHSFAPFWNRILKFYLSRILLE